MIRPVLDRRRLLAAGGGLVLVSGLSPVRVWAQARLAGNPYTLGVAAGDPAPDGFVIWTRLAPEPLEPHGGMPTRDVVVNWEVAEDEGFTKIARSGEALAHPDLAHSVHVEVDGLKPQRPYWYRFIIPGSEPSPVGLAKTAPAAGVTPDRIRIGMAGCQRYEAGYYDAWAHLGREPDLDVVFHYGDYIYEGASGRGAKVNGTGERSLVRPVLGGRLSSLDDYRLRYAQYKMDPDLQAAHAAAAFVISYDDHEVANNYTGDLDQQDTPPEVFALRRAGAMQAWYEHMPVRRAQFPHLGALTMYRRLDYGNLFRMHVMDTRAYRTDQPCLPGETRACIASPGPDSTVLGATQEAWLADGLVNQARWNFIAQQVMVMPLDQRAAGAAFAAYGSDNWNNYPAARARLVGTIAERGLTNVVIGSGDSHQHFIGTVPMDDREPGGPAAATEFLGSSISSSGDGVAMRPDFAHVPGNNPNLKFLNGQRGYQLFDVSPTEWRADIKVIDRVQTHGGALSSAARFVVTPDRAEIHDA